VKKPFWKYTTKYRTTDFGLHWVETQLLERAFESKETLVRYYNAGSLKPGVQIEELLAELTKLGGHIARQQVPNRHQNSESIVIWDGAGVQVEYWTKNRGITVGAVSVDDKLMNSLRAYIDPLIVRTQTKGRIYVVTSSGQGPRLSEMGVAGENFIPSNYRPEAVQQYKHVVDDLNKSDPCGRIVLLDGPPGTGKTHMVRALLNEVPRATFILIPSNYIAQLGDPQFLSVLMREQRKDCPLILILEDADEALVNRKEGNTSAISALLNFSDGIFGTLLDMRLICTTNVEIDNLDPAVTRDGRLCTRMEIGLLDTEMANSIYERLTGKKGELKEKLYKLGTVYKIAKGNGAMVEVVKETKKVGFALGPSRPDPVEAIENLIDALKNPASSSDDILKAAEAIEDIDDATPRDGEFAENAGETITAEVNGELREVGFIDEEGNLHINDDAFPDDEDDDAEDDDANVMPDYVDEGIDDD